MNFTKKSSWISPLAISTLILATAGFIAPVWGGGNFSMQKEIDLNRANYYLGLYMNEPGFEPSTKDDYQLRACGITKFEVDREAVRLLCLIKVAIDEYPSSLRGPRIEITVGEPGEHAARSNGKSRDPAKYRNDAPDPRRHLTYSIELSLRLQISGASGTFDFEVVDSDFLHHAISPERVGVDRSAVTRYAIWALRRSLSRVEIDESLQKLLGGAVNIEFRSESSVVVSLGL